MAWINWPHLFARMRQTFGWTLSSEDVRFRLYFRHAPLKTNANSIRMILEETAWDVIDAVKKYTDRKEGYEAAVRINEHSHLKMNLDEGSCLREINGLFREADGKYMRLLDVCRRAHQFNGGEIPDDLLDAHLFNSKKLHDGLVNAARILNHSSPDGQ